MHCHSLHDVLVSAPDLRRGQTQHDPDGPRLVERLQVQVDIGWQETVQQTLQTESVDETRLVEALVVRLLVVDPRPQRVLVLLLHDLSRDLQTHTHSRVELRPVDVLVLLLERDLAVRALDERVERDLGNAEHLREQTAVRVDRDCSSPHQHTQSADRELPQQHLCLCFVPVLEFLCIILCVVDVLRLDADEGPKC
jgi:hypothetical protein